MAALIVETPAAAFPVSLQEAKDFLRVSDTADNTLITGLIASATMACEAFTGRSFCIKGYRQSLDAFPYYTDTMVSQNAYPPSYYALPQYSTTLWNYSQMVKLFAPPLVSVDRISYLSSADSQWHDMRPVPPLWYPGKAYLSAFRVMDGNNNIQECTTVGTSNSTPPVWNTTLNGTTAEGVDPQTGTTSTVVWTNRGPLPSTWQAQQVGSFGLFIVDADSEPARIFPGPAGQNWPPVLYVPNAVQIHFTSGFATDGTLVGEGPGLMPGVFKTAILQCCASWYENREAALVGKTGGELPYHIQMLLYSKKVMDFSPTRG